MLSVLRLIPEERIPSRADTAGVRESRKERRERRKRHVLYPPALTKP